MHSANKSSKPSGAASTRDGHASDTPPSAKRMLRALDLQKKFKGRPVVRGVSFQVSSGEVVGLLGPNGAGKTTSFYMVVGLIPPDTGNVFLDDTELTSLPMYQRAKSGIAYLPQEASVFRRMTVEENIMAVLETLPLNEVERRERLHRLLDEFNINAIARQKAYTLSGGERRRVEVARALALNPLFLLLDEPFAGIDPIAVADIQKMIAKLKNRGIGILITDHNVRETLAICDLGYLLNDGKIVEKGTPEELVQSQVAREKYLGEKFKL